METIFTYKTLFRIIVASFFLAQVIIWAGEVRKSGLKQWFKSSLGQSWAQYFFSQSRTQRWRLVILWALFFVVIAGSLLLFGFTDSDCSQDIKPEGARLSPRMALDIARRAAEREGIGLDGYDKPDVQFRSGEHKTWSIFFKGRIPMVGNHLTIVIDEQTGLTHCARGR